MTVCPCNTANPSPAGEPRRGDRRLASVVRVPHASRHRFHGHIAGIGSRSGIRVVVGRWHTSPLGSFADAMVETPAGHRVLLAPDERVAAFVRDTYTFDEVRIEPVRATMWGPGGGAGRRARWQVVSPSLRLDLGVGRRTPLGALLRLVPPPIATSPTWCAVTDPVARVALDGVRTRGSARAGRREYYGATDTRGLTAAAGRFDGTDLGALADIDPPTRFGFSSVPPRPSLTSVVTTVTGELPTAVR